RLSQHASLVLTPKTTEASTLPHDLIKQEAHTLDETNLPRLRNHIDKLANATQLSSAEKTLLEDHNQFLSKLSKEASNRWKTKSLMLGKAKVMSYEDLEATRAKCTAKAQDIAGKKRGGQKRKTLLEADILKTEASETDTPKRKKRSSKRQATTENSKRGKRKNAEAETLKSSKTKVAWTSQEQAATAQMVMLSQEQESPRAPVACMSKWEDPGQAPAAVNEAQEKALLEWLSKAQAAVDG
ncbi:MAG: hypothetical protein Q9157_008605, partial [Trypethelium eluteriae]